MTFKFYFFCISLLFAAFPTSVISDCYNVEIGLTNKARFGDALITTTSYLDNDHLPVQSRLDSGSCWKPNTTSLATDYLQIDLGSLYRLCGVVTRGSPKGGVSEWTTKYKLHYSLDNVVWTVYKENGVTMEFTGNTNGNSDAKNKLVVSPKARFVRIQPTGYQGFKCLRVELYGKQQACKESLGIFNRGVDDLAMTASSNQNTASRGRLYNAKAWCSSVTSNTQYLQVDLSQIKTINGIATQGDPTSSAWLTSFTIQYSVNGKNWKDFTDGMSTIKNFTGNLDSNNVRVHWFNKAMAAQYVRVYAQTWKTGICLRMELYGCWASCDDSPLGMATGFIKDSQLNASSYYNTSYMPQNARPQQPGSWCASTDDISPFLQIDLGVLYVICAVALQGNNLDDQWTKTFRIQGSTDGKQFTSYQENGKTKIFAGNTDRNSITKHFIRDSFVVRYLRLLPKEYRGIACMRAEIYGTKQTACEDSSIGVRALGGVPDHRFGGSTVYPHEHLAFSFARLYNQYAWAPQTATDPNDYLQVDLGDVYVLCAIATQGATALDVWCKSYKLSLSMDGSSWDMYKENNKVKIFTGNVDKETVVKQKIAACPTAKIVRIYPVAYKGWKQLRVEFFGVRQECSKSLGLERYMSIDPINQLSSSSQSDSSHSASSGRLYGLSSWCAVTTVNQFFQVDFKLSVTVTGITTQGQSSKWVTSYDLGFGYTTKKWLKLQGFQGNTDDNKPVTHWLPKPIGTRYVRLLPKTWSTSICVRVDFHGCKQVAAPYITSISASSNLTAGINSSINVTCSVYALQYVTITWQLNNTDMTSLSSFYSNDGFLTSVLKVRFPVGSEFPLKCIRVDFTSRAASCSLTVTCEAYYRSNISWPSSKDHVLFTEMDVPDAPMNLTATKIFAHEAKLTWNQSSPTIRERPVIYYDLHCIWKDGKSNLKLSGNLRSYDLDGLFPNTSYTIILRAVSQVGKGFWSSVQVATKATDCYNIGVGLTNKARFGDMLFTATSYLDNDHRPAKSRLDSGSCWKPHTTSLASDYLQIDLGSLYRLCGVVTRGSPKGGVSEWTTKFKLHYSLDNVLWTVYKENGTAKDFSGNFNANSDVKNLVIPSPKARFIRIQPTGYQGFKCLRVEFYGAQQECQEPLGIFNRGVDDLSMTASSNQNTASRGRLYNAKAWCSSVTSNTQYLQVDLSQIKTINGIATQGDSTSSAWLTSFTIQYSVDGKNWKDFTDGMSTIKSFNGNLDNNSVRVHWFNEEMKAQHVRVIGQTWNNGICLRIELYGCWPSCDDSPLGMTTGIIKDSQLSASSHYNISYMPQYGRLQQSGSWCASTDDTSPFLQIDLGVLYVICAVAIQGNSLDDQWTRKFTLQGSRDGKLLTSYMENGNVKIFAGNTNRNSITKHLLRESFVLRYLRFLSKDYHNTACIRSEVYGTKQTACEESAIGVRALGGVPDHRFGGSTVYPHEHLAFSFARLYNQYAWAPQTATDPNDYLQVDLGDVYVLCAIATQGATGANAWCKSYKLSLSTDGSSWNMYKENNIVKIFIGNTDKGTVVKRKISGCPTAKFARIYPVDYERWKQLRVEFFGLRQECRSSLGLERYKIIDPINQLSSSSQSDSSHSASSGRLYGLSSWCAATTVNQFLQVDFKLPVTVTGITTQGQSSKWVTNYDIGFGFTTKKWLKIQGFQGNKNGDTPVSHWLQTPVGARYVRVLPNLWNSGVCLRIDVYGCKQVVAPYIFSITSNGNLTAATGASVNVTCSVFALSHVTITWQQNKTDMTSSSSSSCNNGFATSVLKVRFPVGNVFPWKCIQIDPMSRAASCWITITCEAYYHSNIVGWPSSKDYDLFTEMDIPGVPKQFRATSVRYNSINLSWDSPAIIVREGPIIYYDLHYIGNNVHRNSSLPVYQRHIELDGLVHNTTYTIKLRAVSSVGKGLWATLHVTTKELEPVQVYVNSRQITSFVEGEANQTIVCHGSGQPQPTVRWFYNGEAVQAVDKVFPKFTSQVVQVTWNNITEKLQNVSSRLYLRVGGITLNDAGNYTCKAWNAVNESAEKTVEVLCKSRAKTF
ncbi:uncharacterized protein LOC110252934 [Exaiptasia diaphana]|uniref:Uncharacterized protein n=1 Tax=Exaiptasia diaphana TaxID=2652724 RepID=A0A913YUG8_EXADI|nr:uncharacterized protein LOC110252934 [Exaiptasia diaphana]